jgi:hypothetical protein
VRFRLGGNRGLNIFAPGYPALTTTTCPPGAPSGDVDETISASGPAILLYIPLIQNYLYIWKTPTNWPRNECRLLTMKLIDGTTHSAIFKAK